MMIPSAEDSGTIRRINELANTPHCRLPDADVKYLD